jgi:hypothetical protein
MRTEPSPPAAISVARSLRNRWTSSERSIGRLRRERPPAGHGRHGARRCRPEGGGGVRDHEPPGGPPSDS